MARTWSGSWILVMGGLAPNPPAYTGIGGSRLSTAAPTRNGAGAYEVPSAGEATPRKVVMATRAVAWARIRRSTGRGSSGPSAYPQCRGLIPRVLGILVRREALSDPASRPPRPLRV